MQVHIRLVLRMIAATTAFAFADLPAAPANALAPDTIQLTSGKVLKGLIVRQTSSGVTIQLPYGEETVPNDKIVRIRNVGDGEMWFTKVLEKGSLPPWRVIANDLRNQDDIKSFAQIPATAIDVGIYKYVPYISFRANTFFELNIYGDPDDPAAVEIGMYYPKRSDAESQKLLRQFLGSYLTDIDEVRALYSLDSKKGGSRVVGDITLRISPPSDDDSYGGWWLSFYNKKKLDSVRLSKAAYDKLTIPFSEVHDKKTGASIIEQWQTMNTKKPKQGSGVLFGGFYRDKDGNFRIYDPARSAAN